MTVREIIEELEQFPMDLPVVSNVKEISTIRCRDFSYYLNEDESDYLYTSAVELE